MSSSFVCNKQFTVSDVKIHVVNVSECRKSLRFWNAAFFDAVHGEREIPAIPRLVNFQTLIANLFLRV